MLARGETWCLLLSFVWLLFLFVCFLLKSPSHCAFCTTGACARHANAPWWMYLVKRERENTHTVVSWRLMGRLRALRMLPFISCVVTWWRFTSLIRTENSSAPSRLCFFYFFIFGFYFVSVLSPLKWDPLLRCQTQLAKRGCGRSSRTAAEQSIRHHTFI